MAQSACSVFRLILSFFWLRSSPSLTPQEDDDSSELLGLDFSASGLPGPLCGLLRSGRPCRPSQHEPLAVPLPSQPP